LNPNENFNLLKENWIPVLWNNGKVTRVGIKEALTQAGKIRQIAASNPMDRVAIIRFLLALLYWCKGNPLVEEEITGNSFPADWFSKLDENKDCFNLLGEGKRFYQYIKRGDEPRTANYLIHEVPTRTNKWHFRHSTDGLDGLCQSCCAMGLLRLPLFSTSAGRGYSPGVNAKPPIYVIPVGESLAVTIRLSWRQAGDLGTPAWEKPHLKLPKTGEVPLLTGMTWLPRRVWLSNQEQSESKCISCGCKEKLILSSVFAGVGSTKTDEDGPGRIWRDPHVIYEQSSKSDVISLHARDALGGADAAAGQWAKIMSGIIRENEGIRAWAVGFSTVQNDKYLEAIELLTPFSSSPDQSKSFIAKIEQWQQETWRLASKVKKVLSENEKGFSREHKEIQPALAAFRPHVENQVLEKVGELLAGGDEAWEEAAREYRPMMDAISKSLSPGFTSAAVQRRQKIANTIPDMRTKTESAKKSPRKKGGEK